MNRLVINVGPGFGSVSLVEVFAGINTYAAEPLFTPSVGWGTTVYYSAPDVVVTTDLGDINVLGIGGSPTSPDFANKVSLYFNTVDGKIKMEVNGGGLNANYSISSPVSAIVEVNGFRQSNIGYFGVNPYYNPNSTNNTVINLRSQKDSVQLSLLPSIY